MKGKAVLWAGLIAALGAAVGAWLTGRLTLGAQLSWDLHSMLHPPGAHGRPLQ